MHSHRRRDSTRQLSLVGVGGVSACKSIVLCFALSYSASWYDRPVKDSTQNMMEPSLTYDSGVTTLTFKRARDTGTTGDWQFSDSDSGCYYFMYPVGGGPHTDTDISKHSATPKISAQKICISKQPNTDCCSDYRRCRPPPPWAGPLVFTARCYAARL